MRILVTGGAGFIGSHLVRWLLENHHHVRVLDNFSTGKQENLAALLNDIECIEGDICHFDTVQSALQDTDIVFHLAALVSVVESVEHPLRAYAVNTTGSLHVLEAARLAGVPRVVQMSSAAIYGDAEKMPVSETDPPQPLSPYATTKFSAEQAATLYTHLYDIAAVSLRGFNIYGPRQDPSSPYASVIPRFLQAFHQGKQPTIFGDGLQSRDFVFVGDIVQALWTAATADSVAGKVFNIGRGEAISILDLANTIGKLLAVAVDPIFEPPRSGEVRHSCADVSLFSQTTGYRAATDLQSGLQATIASWLEQGR